METKIPLKVETAGAEAESAGVAPAVAASPRAVRAALNRLIIAGRDEIMALDAAAAIVDGAARRTRLREQAKRRVIFQGDLAAAVTALGGAPAQSASSLAKLMARARRVREVMTGPHAGDAYAVCARAAETSLAAYARLLRLGLSADARFGVEGQQAEVERDRSELRHLRWGANPSMPSAERSKPASDAPERLDSFSGSELDDERALEDWTEDGGAEAGRRAIASARPPLGAVH
jgi:uncharacterized protein (TIGR02284 family)